MCLGLDRAMTAIAKIQTLALVLAAASPLLPCQIAGLCRWALAAVPGPETGPWLRPPAVAEGPLVAAWHALRHGESASNKNS